MAAGGVLILAAVLAPTRPSPAVAQNQAAPVRVINSNLDPVPMVPIGKTEVAGTVRIGNGDQDAAAFRPAGGVMPVVGTVRVESSPQDPIVVCNACERNVVHRSRGRIDLHTEPSHAVPLFLVPAGKRLVIEFASARAQIIGSETVQVDLVTTVNGEEARHALVMSEQGRGRLAALDAWSGAQPMRVYADPDTAVLIEMTTLGRGGSWSYGPVSFSGYLVDL
jgi:hypothetical protein